MTKPDPALPHEVWTPLDHGYRRALDSAGSVAAPLLAGFSFTLLVLFLPSLGERATTVTGRGRIGVAQQTEPFSAHPEPAAVLLLSAGLLLVASVQATINMRKHSHTPGELQQWYPESFREVQARHAEPSEAQASFWEFEGWAARSVDSRWYGAWVRHHLYVELQKANRWANWMRGLYHFGILCLLGGITALVTPPSGQADGWRTVLLGVALLGTVSEFVWIVSTSKSVRSGSETLGARVQRRRRSART